MKLAKSVLAVSVAAIGLLPIQSAFAQDQAGSQPTSEAPDSVIDEIVVTATKRAENLQDVGQTVAAFSGDSVRDLGANDAKDIIGLVPGTGITEPNGGGIPIIIIRGVGLQNFRINDTPTTAVYVDEVYQTSVAEAISAIFDVERVEVLKGPQGGLYGRNAVGGAIQIISAKPNFERFEGYASAGYEKYDRFEGEVVLSGPVSDDLAVRAGGKFVRGGGYFRNVIGNFDYGDADRTAMRLLLEYRPSDTLNLLLKVHGGSDKSDLPLGRPIGGYQPLDPGAGVPNTSFAAFRNSRAATAGRANICAPLLNGGRDPTFCETLNGKTEAQLGIRGRYDGASGSLPLLDNSWWGASLKADIEFGDLTFTSISAYNSFEYNRYIDQDALPEIHQEIDYGSKLEAWSQEFRLGFDNGGPFNWLVGASYAEDEIDEDTLLFTETGLLRATLGGLTRASQVYEQTTEAFAAFGRADWRFTDKLQLIVETRYTEEKKGLDGGTYLPQVNAVLGETDDSSTYDAISGKIALEYSPTRDVLLYASYSEGFKSGGYFGGFATAPGQLDPFDQEEISAIEVGFKTEWPSPSLRLNGSAFYYDRRGVQASGTDISGIVPISRLTNVGDVEVYGAELEIAWQPVKQLTLQGGLSWLENKIVSSDKVTSNILNVPGRTSFVGARLPNQPRFSANMVAQYEEQVGSSLLAGLQLMYSYRGEQDLSFVIIPVERNLLTEGDYQLVNMKISIGPEDRQWKLSAYVENLFDEAYRTNAGTSAPAGFEEIYGAPRIFGVRMETRF